MDSNPLFRPSESLQMHVQTDNKINAHTTTEQTLNFDQSATVRYLDNWTAPALEDINKNLAFFQRKTTNVEKQIENNDYRNEEELEDLQADLAKYQKFISRDTEFKDILNSIGRPIQSIEQVKKLMNVFLKKNLPSQPISDATLEIFLTMIKREAEHSDKYYVMYTGHDKDVEVRMINNHRKDSSPGHECCNECFTNKTFRKKSKLESSTLEEAYKKHIFNENFVDDHSKDFINHFICLNLTLFANITSAESTMQRFLHTHKITKQCPSDNLIIKTKIKNLEQKDHNVIEQIFIRKDVATQLGYASAPYGFPLTKDSDTQSVSSLEILNAMQQGHEVDLNTMESKYTLNERQRKVHYSDSDSATVTTQDYCKRNNIGSSDIQFRLMYIPELYNDKSSVLVFSTTDDPDVNCDTIRTVMNQEVSSPLTSSVDRISGLFVD